MSELLWSIDEKKYDEKPDTLLITGWYAGENGKEYDFALYADSRRTGELSVRARYDRPDVRKALADREGLTNPGFTIAICHITELAENHQELELFLESGEEKVSLWKTDTKKCLSFCKSTLIEYCIDRQQLKKGNVMELSGWVINQRGKTSIRLKNEDGSGLAYEVKRIRRSDVLFVKNLEEDYPYPEVGFVISLKLKEVSGQNLLLCFSGEGVKRICRINVKEFVKQERIRKLRDFFLRIPDPSLGKYNAWYRSHMISRKELKEQQKTAFSYTPLISIVIPLYNTPMHFLRDIIRSVQMQTYPNWQLCLADGSEGNEICEYLEQNFRKEKRLVYKKLDKNGGISYNTNGALELATGDYIMLSDHDDIVSPDALFEIVKALNKNPKLDIVYTDEDKVSMDGKVYFDPHFKSDYNPFLLEGNNYICHIFVVRTSIMKKAGGFRSEFDGAQDYDMILRCCEETTPERICHIPKVLYHWRAHFNSTASNPESKLYAYEAGAKALTEHLERKGIRAEAEVTRNYGIYRVHRLVEGEPLVSMIISMKDGENLKRCLSSILQETTYKNYEILLVANSATAEDASAYAAKLAEGESRVKILTWTGKVHGPSMKNFAAKAAKGDYLLFLEENLEVIAKNWIEEMLGLCQLPETGIVGGKLYFPDNTIEHAGMILGLGGAAGNLFYGAGRYDPCYVGRAIMDQNVSAVSGACMMVKQSVFREADGFSEEFSEKYDDVDLCLKMRRKRLSVVFAAYAELYHYAEKTADMDDTEDGFARDKEQLRKKWGKMLKKGDPFYNPNFSLKESCALKED